MTLGEKLSEKRRNRGMTQDEVAERLGVTPQAVSKWENNISCPDITLLPDIASLYETTIDELLSREPTPTVAVVPPEKRKSIEEMVLHIRVVDGGDRVNVNLPLVLIKAAMETGLSVESMGMRVGGVDLSKIDYTQLIRMIENGMVGRLVEVEGSDGETVVIEVE
ncbi:MAG: helix-turn-helix transcriptional regulator [Clostridia bacterium]|nr:helix-turn-helix transcriptional regulator [Clostridia bacterium]